MGVYPASTASDEGEAPAGYAGGGGDASPYNLMSVQQMHGGRKEISPKNIRAMVGFSVVFHLLLILGLVISSKLVPTYQRVSFPVMQIEMIHFVEPSVKTVPITPEPPKPKVVPVPKKAPPKVKSLPPPALKPAPAEKVQPVEQASPQPAPVETTRREVPEPVVAVDVTNFNYDYYLRLIQNKVEQRWRQPVTGKERRVVIQFTINRMGKMERAAIEESSGDDYFDQTALRAVYAADPFPPLPKGYNEDRLQIHYRFRFGENG